MAHRHIFKIFGSIGPAGAIVSMTEKICTAYFPKAYEYGEEKQFESAIDAEIKKVRADYINELFRLKK